MRQGIQEELTPHQRLVLVSATLEGVPIDVLHERLSSKLRARLAEQGLELEPDHKEAA